MEKSIIKIVNMSFKYKKEDYLFRNFNFFYFLVDLKMLLLLCGCKREQMNLPICNGSSSDMLSIP